MKTWNKRVAVRKICQILNCLALVTVVHSSTLACLWYFHQPALPEEADQFRKFK